MKLKYYLRGLGTGILFATLVLFISYTYHNSDAQIKKRAKELGMIEAENTTTFIEKNTDSGETTNKDMEEPDTTTVEGKVEDETTETEGGTTENNTTTQSVEEATTTNIEEATTQNTEEATTPVNSMTEYEFTIVSGMDSVAVSILLERAGIISNATDFDKYLVSNGYAERIRVGTFKIKEGSSFSDIALLITN